MPSARHYDFALGELWGAHSYIIKSRKGIAWSNLHPDMLAIVASIQSVQDLIEFSLGTEGRWYIKYREGGRVKRKLSKNLWSEIKQDPNYPLERLYLGKRGEFWGVHHWPSGNQTDFRGGTSQFRQVFNNKTQNTPSWDNVKWVAFGCADESYFSIVPDVWMLGSCTSLSDSIKRSSGSGGGVSRVIASPWAKNRWLVVSGNGSIDYSLPTTIAKVVLEYMDKRYSLADAPALHVATPIDVPVHFTGFAMVQSNSPSTIRTSAPVFTPQKPLIELLDHDSDEYMDIEEMFEGGWIHRNKQRDPVYNICAINFPDSLMQPYNTYKEQVERVTGLRNGNEELLFHGTFRKCNIGDSEDETTLCDAALCRLCSLLRQSFRLERAGTAPGRNFLRFGKGIYTTSVSSKAHDYSDTNTDYYPFLRAMVVARVVLGKGQTLRRTDQQLTAPSAGFHSIMGEPGESLNYDEQVVYRADAIRPAYLIIYGDTSFVPLPAGVRW